MGPAQLEFKQTILEHHDVLKVLEKVDNASLDDDHNNQAIAQKLVMDRLQSIRPFGKV